MNFMLETIKGDWEGLFDSWNMQYEFTSVAIKKILKLLRAGIIVPVGKVIRSNNDSVGKSKKGSLVRPNSWAEKYG